MIELQHSHINPQERLSREGFYKNLVCVVDGSRLKHDYPRFLKGKSFFQVIKDDIYNVGFSENSFRSGWLDSSAPVLFDFEHIETLPDRQNKRYDLWCLFPVKIGTSAIVAAVTQNAFVNNVISGGWAVSTR
jgi:competence protein CoiA